MGLAMAYVLSVGSMRLWDLGGSPQTWASFWRLNHTGRRRHFFWLVLSAMTWTI